MLLTISFKPMRLDTKMSIPDLFRCPISLDLFTDPVTLCTGHTYDRPCIEKWISSGNLTCPVTMLSLHDRSMVPNITLSHLITQWLDDQTAEDPSPPPSDDHGHRLAALKETLESKEPIWGKKIHALKQVHGLSMELRENEGLVKFGFLELLIELVFENKIGFTHQRLEFLELALDTAIKLVPFGDPRCLDVIIKQESKIESLLALLEEGTPLIKINLFRLLEAKGLSLMIRNSGEIQRSILDLIELNPTYNEDNEEVSEAAVKLIHAMWLNCVNNNNNNNKQTLEKLVQLGFVGSLVRYIMRSLNRESCQGVSAAMEVIEFMLEVEGGKEALLGEKNGVKAIVKMVFRVCDHEGSESAVKSLLGLCCESIEAREEAVKVGVLTQLLLLLQSQCSLRAKAKARMLLKLLRVMWAKDPLVVY